jgi:hypothetical protein
MSAPPGEDSNKGSNEPFRESKAPFHIPQCVYSCLYRVCFINMRAGQRSTFRTSNPAAAHTRGTSHHNRQGNRYQYDGVQVTSQAASSRIARGNEVAAHRIAAYQWALSVNYPLVGKRKMLHNYCRSDKSILSDTPDRWMHN